MNRTALTLTIVGIFVLNVGLRCFNIAYPDRPVFDEAHFTTYAAAYASHRPYIDIHPPLGKALYAIPLFFADPTTYRGTQFVIPSTTMINSAVGKEMNLDYITTSTQYGGFPYVALRVEGSIWGGILAVSVFVFVLTLTGEVLPAALAVFLVTFENALVTETRLVLMNGMYLSLGFFALALFFKKRPFQKLSGAVWGLSMGVKAIALTFLGPILAAVLLPGGKPWNERIKTFGRFIGMGVIVFGIIMLVVNSISTPAQDRLTFYYRLAWGKAYVNPPPQPQDPPILSAFVRWAGPPIHAAILETFFTLSGYTEGSAHPMESDWYQWPVMQRSMEYFKDAVSGKRIVLTGNPVVWYLGSLSILGGAFYLIWSRRKGRGLLEGTPRVVLLLLSGYLTSLFPFLLIQRSKFLYHYFPGLIFSICTAAVLIAELLKNRSPRTRAVVLGVLGIATLVGFILTAPLTYGL